MNLGQRISGALAALSGSTAIALAENTAADASFREQTGTVLATLGNTTSEIKAALDALTARVEAGETVNPEDFADLKAKIDSLDEAFPDTDVAPVEDDDDEDPIEDNGSAA